MRILYVSHSFPPPGRPLDNVGGMQRVATELHDALAANPDVELSTLALRASWRWTHVRVVPFWASLVQRIPTIVREQGIEVVLFSSMATASVLVLLRRWLHGAGVCTAAIPVGRDVTLPVLPYQRFIVPRVFDGLDLILPISRATAEECVARGAPPDRVHVVPCGADPARFETGGDRHQLRRALQQSLGTGDAPLAPGAFVLCGVGRHIERKGFVWFVDQVMPMLPPDVHFWIAGEGPTTPDIRDAIERHGLGSRVRLLGRVSDEELALLYGASDLFVMPNIPVAGDIEGFGVVMLEAGFSGLPTVAARLEGIQDAIRDGENGVLLPPGDARAFARTILRFRNDHGALAAASDRAVRYTASTFAWPGVADRYMCLFREVRGRERERAAGAAVGAG